MLSCSMFRSGTDGARLVTLRHLVERENLVVAGVSGCAELRQALEGDLLLRPARGLEERTRIDLGRARLDRLAQRGGDREPPIGVDIHLAHAVADSLLDLLYGNAERCFEFPAGRIDPVDELLRNARR